MCVSCKEIRKSSPELEVREDPRLPILSTRAPARSPAVSLCLLCQLTLEAQHRRSWKRGAPEHVFRDLRGLIHKDRRRVVLIGGSSKAHCNRKLQYCGSVAEASLDLVSLSSTEILCRFALAVASLSYRTCNVVLFRDRVPCRSLQLDRRRIPGHLALALAALSRQTCTVAG